MTTKMSETTMPATEADVASAHEDERNSYEFAFHILPTVAEGEVPGAFEELKALITKAGGEFITEEAPERIDLAYEIVKSIEGKNRKFASAYFGWVRFKLPGENIESLTEAIDNQPFILRYIIIRLTKLEEAHSFRFHENRKSVKMVEIVDEAPVTLGETQTEEEKPAEVSEKELDESLDKITSEEGDRKEPEEKEEEK